MKNLMPQLDGSITPEAEFLKDNYLLAISRYEYAAKFTTNKIVLEAGSGAGYGAEILARKAKKVYGVDNSAAAIKISRKHRQKNLEFIKGDIAKLDFPDRYFDVIVAYEIIEHLKNYQQAISEFYRVLKKGGRLILSTPNKAVYSPGTKKPFYPFHFKEFTREELVELLASFGNVKIQGQFLKGKNQLIYGSLDPRRLIRILFANLPFFAKKQILVWFLLTTNWASEHRIIRVKPAKKSDIYYSDNTTKTRTFICVAQKT